MFGFIFALIIAVIVLVAVSYVAVKLYNAVQVLSAENEQLKNDHARAAQAAIEYCTLAEDIRSDLRKKSFEMMDMEKALNLALEETMPAQVEIKPVQEFPRFYSPLAPMILGGPRKGKTGLQEKIVERLSEENPHALIYMSTTGVIPAKDIWLENLKTGERRELSDAHVEFSAHDNEKFDTEFPRFFLNETVSTDTLTFDLSEESVKTLSYKIPGPEMISEWEKELRKNPEDYTELPRPEKRELAKPSDEEVTRILDGVFGPDKKTED